MKKFILSTFLSINLSLLIAQDYNDIGNQRAWYETSRNLIIDTIQIDSSLNRLHFQFQIDSLISNDVLQNFLWIKDSKHIYFKGFIINGTDSLIRLDLQDGSLMMIQEALDEDSLWKPIEYWVYSGCGNSYFNPLNLNPYTYLMVPIRKYFGEYKTKMRLKLKNGKKIIYSNTFKGSINKSQFTIKNEDVRGILYHGKPSYFNEKKGK